MTGIFIPNMEIPKNCWDCPCSDKQNGVCEILSENIWDNRLFDCPLLTIQGEDGNGFWITNKK